MPIIALVAGKGSPGVTSCALALTQAWPLTTTTSTAAADTAPGSTEPARILMVEADPSGSTAGPGYLRGQMDPDRGLTEMLAAGPTRIGARLPHNVILLNGHPDRQLLLGPAGPAQTAAATDAWPELADVLHAIAHNGDDRTDVLLDFGRVAAAAEPAPLLQVADLTVVVSRTSLASVSGALHAVRYLHSPHHPTATGAVGCVLVGEHQPYSRTQIAASLAVPVIGVLGWDPPAAAVYAHGAAPHRQWFRPGPLQRSAPDVAVALVAASQPAGLHRSITREVRHG